MYINEANQMLAETGDGQGLLEPTGDMILFYIKDPRFLK
jgi:hypothetical protein